MPTARNGAAELAYDARGVGPPVLLMHAGVTDRRSWAPLVAHLGEGYRTIAYDRRGFGETSYEPEPHDPVADAVAVLDAEGVDRAVVIGASNGGRWSIELALAQPERVSALVLIGAGTRGGPEDDPTDYSAEVQALWHAYEAAEEGDDLDALNRIEAHAWLDGWAAPEGRVTGAGARPLPRHERRRARLARRWPGARAAAGVGSGRGTSPSPPSCCAATSTWCAFPPASTSRRRSRTPGSRSSPAPATCPTWSAHPRCLAAIAELLSEPPPRA